MKKICAKSRDVARGATWTSDQWLWRQMSNYILVSLKVWCLRSFSGGKPVLVKVIQDSTACFHLFTFFTTTVIRNEPQSTMERYSQKFAWQLCKSSEFYLYSHALSLEIAALAEKRGSKKSKFTWLLAIRRNYSGKFRWQLLSIVEVTPLWIDDHFDLTQDEDKSKPGNAFNKIEQYCNPRRNEVAESNKF